MRRRAVRDAAHPTHEARPVWVINSRQPSRPPRKKLLRDRTPTLPIADMRHVVADFDDRPRHSGGGCTLSKQTPRPAAVASPKGQEPPPGLQKTIAAPLPGAREIVVDFPSQRGFRAFAKSARRRTAPKETPQQLPVAGTF